jgi:hypothetical protein
VPAAAIPQQHQHSRSRSLSEAIGVSQTQARAMLTAYPALSNYNHVTLRQKLQELAGLLQVGSSYKRRRSSTGGLTGQHAVEQRKSEQHRTCCMCCTLYVLPASL